MQETLLVRKNAQPTKIIFRAILVAVGISALLIGLYMYWSTPAAAPTPVTQSTSIVAVATPIPTPVVTAVSTISSEQKKIPPCLEHFDLKKMPTNLQEMKDLFWDKIGPPEREKLQWRNIHYTESDGSKRRLRVSLSDSNSGRQRYELRLYTVDEEDLPVPMESVDKDRFNATKNVIQKYLQGREISFDSSLTDYEYANGASLEVELENKAVKTLHYRGRDFSLGCSLDKNSNEPDCSCLH